jgi:dTDP-4-amino-4,6-dideoxygalactose transaminase
VDIGSSFLPSDILAAFLFAQLEAKDQIQASRGRIWKRYDTDLRDWAGRHNVRLPIVPEYCEQPYHMYYVLMPSLESRQALINYLKSRDILTVFHYQPLHLSAMGQKFGGKVGDCPVTEDISDRLLRLPLFNDYTDAEQTRVIEAMYDFEG